MARVRFVRNAGLASASLPNRPARVAVFPSNTQFPSERCASLARGDGLRSTARAVFAYDDASRGLVLGFKYADRIHHGPAFGRWLARTGAALLVDADLIVPVPLHRWRLFHRRYNQAGLLAQALGREADKPVNVDLLVRQRRTRTQGRMPRSARIRNIQGAFKLRAGRRAAAAGARFC